MPDADARPASVGKSGRTRPRPSSRPMSTTRGESSTNLKATTEAGAGQRPQLCGRLACSCQLHRALFCCSLLSGALCVNNGFHGSTPCPAWLCGRLAYGRFRSHTAPISPAHQVPARAQRGGGSTGRRYRVRLQLCRRRNNICNQAHWDRIRFASPAMAHTISVFWPARAARCNSANQRLLLCPSMWPWSRVRSLQKCMAGGRRTGEA